MRGLSPRHCIVAGGAAIALGLAMATTGAVVDPVHAHADDDPGSGLSSYGLTASAGGLQFFASQATGEADTADGGIPYSTASTLYGPTDSALSSVAWPGALGGDLGSLLLVSGLPTGFVPLPIALPPPPAIPTQLDPYLPLLNDPVQASAHTGGETDVTNNDVPGSEMEARVETGHAVAEAQLAGVLNLITGTARSTRTRAETQLTTATEGTATSESEILDMDLPGGVVSIGSITSTATATTDGTSATVSGQTVIADATVAGIPVSIDSTGVHVQSKLLGVPLQKLVTAVDSALTKAGIQLYLSQAIKSVTGSTATFTAGDLVITFPEGIVVEVGGSQVGVQSSELGDFDGGGGTLPITTPTLPAGDDTGSQPSTGAIPGTPGSADTLPPSGGGTGTPQIAPTNASATLPTPSGLGWGWIALLIAGAGLVAVGLRRLPDRALMVSETACNLGEDA